MIILDYKDKRPIFEQVTEKLKRLICKGVIAPEEKLPSVRNMAVELSINPNTISRAYQQLEGEGYIYSVKGKGSFVAAEEEIMRLKCSEYKHALGAIISDGKAQGFSAQDIINLINETVKEVYND